MPDLGLCPSPEGNTFRQEEENNVEMMDIRIPPILTEKGIFFHNKINLFSEIALPRQNSEKRKRVFDESESENENCDFSIFSETLIDHMISSVNIPGQSNTILNYFEIISIKSNSNPYQVTRTFSI